MWGITDIICVIAGASCVDSDLSINSKCYRKFYNSSSLSWFSASNDCLSRGGSLAVFTDIGRPSDNSQLTQWLSKNKTYWIGLVRSWWQTANRGTFWCIEQIGTTFRQYPPFYDGLVWNIMVEYHVHCRLWPVCITLINCSYCASYARRVRQWRDSTTPTMERWSSDRSCHAVVL